MPDTTLPDLVAFLTQQEGCEQYLYLDPRGNVTVGVGHLCATSADAERLPFIKASTNRAATQNEIDYAWACLKYQPLPPKLLAFYGILLEQPAIRALLLQDTVYPQQQAADLFQGFIAFPQPAKVAILDMLFNLGSLDLFPNFVRAVRESNWAEAANQCVRRGVSTQRNIDTQELLLSCESVSVDA